LFYGPPGTGKTVAAQALALESGWAFLSVAGPDLLTDRDRLGKLYREACDLRPTLVFIDEADDILRHRAMSPAPDAVNRLLALMDGSGARVPDVVFLAATNHPGDADPALLRAGRFTEKIEFFPPPEDQIACAVRRWLGAKGVELHGITASEVAQLLSGRSMADVNGVMQYALNRAITDSAGPNRAVIRRQDIEAAQRAVLG
jgi:transitional endoplasmic reticulum ATPase